MFVPEWFKKSAYILLSTLISLLLVNSASANSMDDLMNAQPRYIITPNGRIEYFVLGKGKPIVLISGYAAYVGAWSRKFLLPLVNHNQVIIFNNRNVGDSYNKSTSYNSKDLANDTYTLINQLHLHKPTIIGVSMGGMVAQQLAVSHSDVVRHLVLINTAIAGNQSAKPSDRIQKLATHIPKNKIGRFIVGLSLMAPPFAWPQVIHELKTDRFTPKEDHPESVITQKTLKQQQQLVLDWSNDNATAKKIADLQIPTLILNGERDAMIPPANSVILAETIPNAKLKRWPNGGHMMIYQYPDSITDAILEFIKQ